MTLRPSFHGVSSYTEALNLMRNGYQQTVDRLQVAMKGNFKGEIKRFRFENQVYGFAPVVPLAIKGIPNCMIDMKMRPMKSKVIDIYYDITVNFGYTSEQIIQCGQKILGAIVDLEKQGFRFNLYCLIGFCGSNSGDFLCVKVKDSDKPFDLKRVSFTLTHTAFFRVMGFDWQDKSPIARYRHARGMALNDVLVFNRAQELIRKIFGEHAIYISCQEINYKSDEHIREVLSNERKNK